MLLMQLRADGTSALSSVTLSDSLPPVTLGVWSNRCWSPAAALTMSCALTSVVGQAAGASPVVVVQASPAGLAPQPVLCSNAALGGAVPGVPAVQLPFSVSLALAFRSPGGSSILSCTVKPVSSTAIDAAASAVAMPLTLAPTGWPLYDDVIAVSAITVNSVNGSALTYSRMLRSSIDIASLLIEACVNTSSSPTSCTLPAAMSSLQMVLQAVTAAWSGIALPAPSLATQSSFSLSLGGSALLVLRARAVAFSSASTVAVSGIPCPGVLASPDGRWLIVQVPSLQKLQCQGLECGYAALAVSTPGGSSATALGSGRRLDSNATAYPYRGAALVCPPFCPGLLLPASASGGVVGGAVVPVALDASGTLFAPLPQITALTSPGTASSVAATALASSSGAGSSSAGFYFSPTCSSSSFTDPLTGACANANDPASTQCGLGSGDSCSRCPSGALCPGGTRLWPRPGNYASSEREAGVVACAPPAPQSRCLGWDAAQGVTACGSGYRPASYMCASCADGWFMQDDGSCVACPASPGSGAAAWWSAYRGTVILAAVVLAAVCFASVTLHKSRHCGWPRAFVRPEADIGEYDAQPLPILIAARSQCSASGSSSVASSLLHSASSLCWFILAVQVAGQVSSRSMLLLLLFASPTLLRRSPALRRIFSPPSCTMASILRWAPSYFGVRLPLQLVQPDKPLRWCTRSRCQSASCLSPSRCSSLLRYYTAMHAVLQL